MAGLRTYLNYFIPTQMTVIVECWGQLWNWVMNSSQKYEVDWNTDIDRRYFKECIDYVGFNSDEINENDKQLDLLVPN